MKVLLALSLLFFLDFVFSQELYKDCNLLNRCPIGYTPKYSGRTHQKAACICKKDPPKISRCSRSIVACSVESACSDMESNCSLTEIINTCNRKSVLFRRPEVCDRANQRLRKENNPGSPRTCEFNKNQCNRGANHRCISAATTCDPDTTIELCKNNKIPLDFLCEAAEIQKEKERVEDSKYSCDHAQRLCQGPGSLNFCSDIAKFCDLETAAKWCFNDDTTKREKKSDEDCFKVIKKSQYLMFGKSKQECSTQVSLCEEGHSEACMQVPTLCVKEVVSDLCNTNIITNKRICAYASWEERTSSPACQFFADKCAHSQDENCQLVSRVCDDETNTGDSIPVVTWDVDQINTMESSI